MQWYKTGQIAKSSDKIYGKLIYSLIGRMKQWAAKWLFCLSRFYSNGFQSIVNNFNRLVTPFQVESEWQCMAYISLVWSIRHLWSHNSQQNSNRENERHLFVTRDHREYLNSDSKRFSGLDAWTKGNHGPIVRAHSTNTTILLYIAWYEYWMAPIPAKSQYRELWVRENVIFFPFPFFLVIYPSLSTLSKYVSLSLAIISYQ